MEHPVIRRLSLQRRKKNIDQGARILSLTKQLTHSYLGVELRGEGWKLGRGR